jgi:hypothetical protein
MTRSQRRKRARQSAHTPGALARRASLDGVALDANPNTGKRSASPMNWEARTIASATLRQPAAALIVAHPLRTPTGRIATRAGEPQYSSYTVGSTLPGPIVRDS